MGARAPTRARSVSGVTQGSWDGGQATHKGKVSIWGHTGVMGWGPGHPEGQGQYLGSHRGHRMGARPPRRARSVSGVTQGS